MQAVPVITLPFDYQPRTRVVFGPGAFGRLGDLARELSFARVLLVADRGLVEAGYVDRAEAMLGEAGIRTFRFHDFAANPDSAMVEAGRAHAAVCGIDAVVALGGGSSLDCAKGINFVLTNGGLMRDYRGFGKAARPLLPMIGVPTTTGTGSEAQSYAIISDAETHAKMACGDPTAAFRVAILDPELAVTQPASVTAITGIDAVSHAVEAYVTRRRTALSDLFAREAWRLLDAALERAIALGTDLDARSATLLGAFYAGAAVEQSMLGAAHACANPLTARYGTTHGIAIAVMLPWVVRWNADHVDGRYGDLLVAAGRPADADAGGVLAARLDDLVRAGGLPRSLRDLGADPGDVDALARDAAGQWTGTFNPRPFDEAAARSLYAQAFGRAPRA